MTSRRINDEIEKMNLYIDTEFNGFNGQLISMALVAQDGREFYWAVTCTNPVPWVLEHVIPILNTVPIDKASFKKRLEVFLNQWEEVCIIADWPEDIQHLCESLITGPGRMMATPNLEFKIVRIDAPSELPHNALADARGIKKALNP